ncbi:atpase mitochondrial precursor [Malassezia pachydermatis]|uniref:ATPase inhibitor, mitochondrial n=1 Tax=Malassezia pachydermatis TaxID=77020 RepID=A0A0M9VRB4_9BASI|nr:atpase mitochondrial precursor [Malassezia pachydermatis]KOS16435.1 atpase mitochondrial precursor [Malassezia pachydermatis]
MMMQALRVRTPLVRSTARMMTVRMYSPGPEGSAGSVASSKGWNRREKAQEDQYILEHEKEKLAKLRESVKHQENLVENLTKEEGKTK